MSILNYMLDPSSVAIITDTLASTSNGKPFKYITKLFLLPHIKTIVVGTGCIDLLINWYVKIQKDVIVKNIKSLDEITTNCLNDLYKNIEIDSSVYHFGYDNDIDKYIGFAYRSKNLFKSENLIYGVGVKPGNGVEELIKNIKNTKDPFEELLNITKKQKEIDDNKNHKDRAGIGGSIILCIMDKLKYYIDELFVFDDFQDNYIKMLKNIKKEGGILF
ncbi:hypothetical protein KAX02_04430 [candidate division WOR-3 bacterium]|nr:hypothetical protein [candidate division WOR-3 bacterium]